MFCGDFTFLRVFRHLSSEKKNPQNCFWLPKIDQFMVTMWHCGKGNTFSFFNIYRTHCRGKNRIKMNGRDIKGAQSHTSSPCHYSPSSMMKIITSTIYLRYINVQRVYDARVGGNLSTFWQSHKRRRNKRWKKIPSLSFFHFRNHELRYEEFVRLQERRDLAMFQNRIKIYRTIMAWRLFKGKKRILEQIEENFERSMANQLGNGENKLA